MRVVLDTNILISALVSGRGTLAQILARCHAGELELLLSPDGVAELRRVLRYPDLRKRFTYTDAQIDAYLALLAQIATVVVTPPAVRAVPGDAEDDKFVALAVAGQAQYIISGDGHLLDLGQVQGIPILKPAAFWRLWQVLQQDADAQ